MSEVKRNLADDLALCDAASSGEWHIDVDLSFDAIFVKDGRRFTVAETYSSVNAAFIAAARTGWPDAIRRAMAAEERLMWYEHDDQTAVLKAENERLRRALRHITAISRYASDTPLGRMLAMEKTALQALDGVGDVR